MAQLMGDDPGQLSDVRSRYERKPEREDQVISEKAFETAPKGGSGVEVAIDINARWKGRADCSADAGDKGKEQWFASWVERKWLGIARTPGQERLDHEKKDNRA